MPSGLPTNGQLEALASDLSTTDPDIWGVAVMASGDVTLPSGMSWFHWDYDIRYWRQLWRFLWEGEAPWPQYRYRLCSAGSVSSWFTVVANRIAEVQGLTRGQGESDYDLTLRTLKDKRDDEAGA